MKLLKIIAGTLFMILVVVFAILVILNPSKKQHEKAFADALRDGRLNSPKSLAEINIVPVYHNYIIFSTTEDMGGESSNPISIGYCGKVYIRFYFVKKGS